MRLGLVLSLLVLSAITVPWEARSSSAEPPLTSAAAPRAGSYIVSFDPDQVTVDQMTAAVDDSGGTVLEVLEPLGVALVESDDTDFHARAPAGHGVIDGAARNWVVGADGPPPPSRADQAMPTAEQRRLAEVNAGAGALQEAPPGTSAPGAPGERQAQPAPAGDPFETLQWGNALIGATPEQAHQLTTGAGVTVGVIDTGIDGTHPDLGGNLDLDRSRDLVTGEDGVAVDPHGHGTHVAGIVGAARDGVGIAGVAPAATLVNLRAGSDGGHFLVYEVSAALVAAAEQELDVVVMSFYTQPWLYNCASAEDYVSGSVSGEEIAEQAMVRETVLDALAYAHDHGVTLVSAVGNEAIDLSAPQRTDDTSPGYPRSRPRSRVVTDTCLDLPNEGPNVISAAAVGPSGERAGYSNHGLGSVDLAAPGGWFDDFAGTDRYKQAGNLVLSSYPLAAAQGRGLADESGEPTDASSLRNCAGDRCGFYTYQEGTSMAAPYVAGVAALVIEREGQLLPGEVAEILYSTAQPRSCSGHELCEGSATENSLYGRGLVDAAAVAAR